MDKLLSLIGKIQVQGERTLLELANWCNIFKETWAPKKITSVRDIYHRAPA